MVGWKLLHNQPHKKCNEYEYVLWQILISLWVVLFPRAVINVCFLIYVPASDYGLRKQ